MTRSLTELTFSPEPPSICKICGTPSPAWRGNADLQRTGSTPEPFPPSNLMVDYFQCVGCGFVWAPAFDQWRDEDFSTHIYNQQIGLVETPENAAERCRNVDQLLTRWFGSQWRGAAFDVLDYGCGAGLLVDALRARGIAVAGYDRFVPAHAKRPAARFDLVTCFEVLEHLNQPSETLADLASLLKPNGILVIGTYLASQPFDSSWWYCAPRSGHVAFWTFAALRLAFQRYQLNVASDGQLFHFVFPDAAKPRLRHLLGG